MTKSVWRGRAAVLVAFVGLLALLSGPLVPASAAQVAFVSGTVYKGDHPTEGLFGVNVYLIGEDGLQYGFANTGGTGEYTMSAPAGEYFVHFLTTSGPYEGHWWENALDLEHATPITMVVGSPVSGVDATLAVRGSVSGTSFLHGSTSSSGGYVWLVNCTTGSLQSVISSATTTGTAFTLQGVPPGKYVLGWNVGTSPNIIPGWWENTFDESEAQPFTVALGQDVTGMDLHSQVAASAYGRITSPSSEQGDFGVFSQVILYDLDGIAVRNVYTYPDAGGYFSLNGLRAGVYKVRAFPGLNGSQRFAPAWWGGGDSFDDAGLVEIAYGRDNVINIVVSEMSAISGTVRNAAGSPVANALVAAWSRNGDGPILSVSNAFTSADGTYTLSGLSPSSYWLTVSGGPGELGDAHLRPDSSTIEPEYWPTASSLWQGTRIVVPSLGAQIGPVDFTVRAAGSLSAIPAPAPLPAIVGDASLGQTLTVDAGVQWGGVSDLTFSYQWLRDGLDITGQNQASYTPVAADLYHRLSVVVSATKAGYSWQHARSAETYPVTDPSATGYFADVRATNPFFSQIEWMATEGISTGTANPPGSPLYKPVDPISRQAFAAFLYRYSGESFTPPDFPTFKDVSKTNPFYTAIEWMADRGISTGTVQPCGRPLFNPASEISRQAVAAFLARFAQADLTDPGPQYFADVPSTSTFAAAIGWMKTMGISTGTEQGSGLPLFKPTDSLSRQAVAAFLARYDSVP